MRILLASSEVHPYSKTGGLADMVGSLGKYLARAGERIALVTPLYSGIEDRFPDLQPSSLNLEVQVGANRVRASVKTCQPEPNFEIYFIDQPALYNRPALYGERGADYTDNPERFIFFSKCIAALARQLDWRPQIVHLHDWQTGLVPLLIFHQSRREGWMAPPRTCFTIHNLAFQGIWPAPVYALTNLPWDYFNVHGVEYHANVSALKAGIVYSDLITTVSPTYAKEITTPEYGCGLDGLLRLRKQALVGILNGVDYSEWNTENNPHLKWPYSASDLSGKTQNKLALQDELGLPQDASIPLFGTVGRLTDQKGMDIALGALEEMLAGNIQFVILGNGDPRFEKGFDDLAHRHPEKVAVRFGFNPSLSHRIEAGCDFFLMPSRFEPCGLNQMYSLRYGTIPIVRATGGLVDSITDPRDNPGRANGIKFHEYSSAALAKAMRKALVIYEDDELRRELQGNGMRADYSWEKTATEYQRVYGQLTGPL